MTSLTVTGKILGLIVVAALAVGALALFGVVTEGCRATVPVVVNQVNQNCRSTVHNSDGTLTHYGCRYDGKQPTTTGGSPGDENISVPKPNQSSAIPLETLERYALKTRPVRDPRLN